MHVSILHGIAYQRFVLSISTFHHMRALHDHGMKMGIHAP